MREILFRGKTKAIVGCPYNNGKPDGEWVNGYIFPDLGAMKIRQFEPDRPECNDYEIDSETVGQYTGLTDKNGVRIFEGDIAEYEGKYYVVRYSEKYARFLFTRIGSEYSTFTVFDYKCCEVIGNIHDNNPEILKGGGDNG